MHSATVVPRIPMSSPPRCAGACVALAALACLVLTACSPGADYPSLFPSVHDVPPPRADTPLDSNQVQQATEDLITARDRLTAEAQGGQAKSSSGSTGAPANAAANAKTGTKPAAKSAGPSAGKPSGNAATAAAASESGHRAGAGQALGTEAAPDGGTETK